VLEIQGEQLDFRNVPETTSILFAPDSRVRTAHYYHWAYYYYLLKNPLKDTVKKYSKRHHERHRRKLKNIFLKNSSMHMSGLLSAVPVDTVICRCQSSECPVRKR
jgi:hypothetical protein